MSKYIKVFDTLEEYTTYSGSTGFVSPNISYVKANDKSYYDNNEIKHYTQDTWIEVIPKEEYTDTTFDVIKTIYKVDIPNGTTTINQGGFRNCSNLVEVIIPNTVTEIKGGTVTKYGTYENDAPFENCSSLTSIEIPSGVTYIGINAFKNCTSLSSITFSSGSILTEIRDSAFNYCSALTSIDIPNSVTSIGGSAFWGCTSLTSITIPSSVTSIGNSVFRNCSNLTNFTISAVTPPTLGSLAFNGANNCLIYVPTESVDAYKAATNWSSYADRIQAIPNN